MRGLILAAGRGSRMGALTHAQPKCLVDFGGRPLLEWQQTAFAGAGVTRVGIVVGYCKEAFGSKYETFESPRWETTNMVRSLQCAHEWLSAEPCVVSYSDIFYEPHAVASLMGAIGDLAVLYDPNWRSQWEERFEDPLADAETFRIDATGNIVEIGDRPFKFEQIEGQYMGLLRFTPTSWTRTCAYLKTLPDETIDRMSMTRLLSNLIAAGEIVSGLPYQGFWGEIDSASDLKAQEARLTRRLLLQY